MAPTQFYSPLRLATFVVLLAAGLTVALLPIDPQREPPVVGQTPAEPLLASAALSFESEALLEEARAVAGQAAETFFAWDLGVRQNQVDVLTNRLDAIDLVRDDPALSEAERTAALFAIPDLDVNLRGQILILGLSDSQWRRVKHRALDLIAEILNQSVGEDEVETVRESVPDQVGVGFTEQQGEIVADLVAPLIAVNFAVDEARTGRERDNARAAIGPVICEFGDGDTVFAAGVPVHGSQILSHCSIPDELDEVELSDGVVGALAAEALLQFRPEGRGVPGDDLVAVLILAVAAALTLGAYLLLNTPDAAAANRRLILIGVLVVGSVAVARWYFPLVLPDEREKFLDLALPLATAAVLIAALLERTLALVVATLVAVLVGIAAMLHPNYGLTQAPAGAQALRPVVVILFSSIAGVFVAQRVERLTQYGVTGGVVGATVFVVGLGFWLLDPARETAGLGWLALAAAIVAVSSGVIIIGAFSFLGLAFGITTRLHLLDLAQLTQPLLRRLQEEAPGTFHHSLIVATMAERAASQIGADALLVRVGAYYHDIGKLAKPHMYIENQSDGTNPHEDLDPLESAKVIQEHVHWGLELARRHRLPVQVRAFIPEHHGTRLVTYFYRKATQHNPDADPALFTYDGPRPQTRETAILMMADSCEAVVRSSRDRDVQTIDRLVDGVINERLNERQFDDCDLTLRQLRRVGESFKLTLRGVYHPRIEYPEPTAAERRVLRAAHFPKGITAAPEPVGDAPVDGSALPTIPRSPDP